MAFPYKIFPIQLAYIMVCFSSYVFWSLWSNWHCWKLLADFPKCCPSFLGHHSLWIWAADLIISSVFMMVLSFPISLNIWHLKLNINFWNIDNKHKGIHIMEFSSMKFSSAEHISLPRTPVKQMNTARSLGAPHALSILHADLPADR